MVYSAKSHIPSHLRRAGHSASVSSRLKPAWRLGIEVRQQGPITWNQLFIVKKLGPHQLLAYHRMCRSDSAADVVIAQSLDGSCDLAHAVSERIEHRDAVVIATQHRLA